MAATFPIDNISVVALSNANRLDEGKNLALIIYAVAGLSHVLMSLLVALVISWRVPESVLSQMPYAKDVRVATFYWWYAWLSVTFLLSCAGGTITMVVIILLYAIIVIYIIVDALCRCRLRCTERNRPPDHGGRSLQAAARIKWLLSGGTMSVGGPGSNLITGGAGVGAGGGVDSDKAKSSSSGKAETNISFLDMDNIKMFEPLPENFGMLPQQEQIKAQQKINSIIKLSKEGTDDKKKPWSYYPDRNPDGSASDTQIALEEAAAWKVRRAFGDKTEMTENGQLKDADSGVVVGSKMETAMRLARMLMRYSPGSLERMEQVLESYRLQEDRLFGDLEKKYGPEPTRLERKKWVGQQRARGSMSAEEVAKTFTVPELPTDMYWTRCPVRPVAPQLAFMIVCGIFIVLCAVGMFSATIWWPLPEYRVVVDVTSSSGQKLLLSQPEIKPTLAAKAEFFIYGWPGTASEMRVQQYVDFLSRVWYAYIFHRYLATDEERHDAIQTPFVDAYGVDMSTYIGDSYRNYSTADEWWGRIMQPGVRRLAPGWNTTGYVIAPCDGRYTAFSNMQRARRYWIKGGRFSFEELIGGGKLETGRNIVQGNPSYFTGGTLILARLAVADYHRFHAPVSGKILDVFKIKKHEFSNTPTAVQSGNNVLFNTRWVIYIDTDAAVNATAGVTASRPSSKHKSSPSLGVVAVVFIGSTFAGSVSFRHKPFGDTNASAAAGEPLVPGSYVRAGDELGRFHLGGSTIVMLFRPGAAAVQCSVFERSSQSVETLMKLGSRIGVNRGTVEGESPDFCI